MALNFTRFIGGINLVGTSSSAVSVAGEIEFFTGTNKLNFHNGTTAAYLVDETHQATLTNKIFSDSTAVFGNVSDTSKQVIFSIGGQTSAVATTLIFASTSARSITFPDATGTIAFTNGAGGQTLTNTNLSDSTCFIVNVSDPTKKFGWSLGGATASKTITFSSSHTNNRTITIPDATDTLAVLATQQTFTNKIFSDSTAAFGNVGDTTKQLAFSLGGATAGQKMTLASSHTTARTLTLPDTTDTFAVLALQQTFTNKIFSDSTAVFGNVGDTTKQLAFSLGGATAGQKMTFLSSHTTARTLTFPDATDTVAVLAATQTLTNKTVGDSVTFTQISTPANPASSNNKLYVKSNNKFYTLTSGGVEQQLGSGTGGAKNYLSTYLNNTGNGDLELGATTGWSLAHSTLSSSVPTSVAAAGTAFDSSHGGTAATALAINIQNTQSIATTATWVNGNNFITVASATGLVVGQIVTNPGAGTGFPTPPTGGSIFITNISSTSIYLNKAVTGTQAGASNMTFASTPLGGTWSMSLGTSSQSVNLSSTAGDLVISSAFTIDTEDQAKAMQISFYYQNQAGAALSFAGSSANSHAVYIYDVSNAAWIQPAGVYNLTQSSGVGRCIANFQTTSNSTQYQIALINVTATSSLSYNLYLDDFFVGPQIAPIGAIISDWTSFTPTGSWSTNCTYTGVYRRIGGDVEVQVKIALAGAPTSASLTVNLPSGLTFDTTRLANNDAEMPMGLGGGKSAGANCHFYCTYNSTTSVLVAYQSSITASQSAVTQAAPGTFANADEVNLFFRGPIVGWASTTNLSSDTDTRVVAAAMTGATATVTGSYSDVTWTTIVNDTHGAMGAINYTVPVTGYYDIIGALYVTAGTIAAGNAAVTNLFNTTTSTTLRESTMSYQSTNTGNNSLDFSFKAMFFTAGTQFKIQTKSSATSPVITSSATNNFLSITRASGPAVVAATESVNAKYHTSVTAISGANANITFTTKDFDSHNAYSAGTYTVPVSGKYAVNAALNLQATTTALGNLIQIVVQKNGATSASNQVYYSGAGQVLSVWISDLVSCNAGDTITIQGSSGATTPSISGNNNENYFTISRVGN